MKKTRVVTLEDVQRAVRNCQSNMMAARYLGLQKLTWKKWAEYYKDSDGISYYEKLSNKNGKGLKKSNKKPREIINDVLEGKVPIWWISKKDFHTVLITEGFFEEKCDRCGFCERRELDLKVPLILRYKDGNQKNAKLDNLHFLCYNCYFITVGDVFKETQLKAMQNYNWNIGSRIEEIDLPEVFEDEYNKSIGLSLEVVDKEEKIEDYVRDKKKITVEDVKDELDEKDENFGMDLVSFLKK